MAATVHSTAAAAFLAMGLFHYSFGRRGAVASYLLSTVSLLAAVTLPLLLRSRPAPEAPIPPTPASGRAARPESDSHRHRGGVDVLRASAPSPRENSRTSRASSSRELPGPFGRFIPPSLSRSGPASPRGNFRGSTGSRGSIAIVFPASRRISRCVPEGSTSASLDRLGLVSGASRRPRSDGRSRSGPSSAVSEWMSESFAGGEAIPADEVQGFVVSEYFHRQVREEFESAAPPLDLPRGVVPG